MQRFHFKSGGFELLLEGYEDPVQILQNALAAAGAQDIDVQGDEGDSDGQAENGSGDKGAISIDSFMAERRPGSGRKMLEETARYITNVLDEETFSKEQLVEVAMGSKHFRRDWRNQNSVNISRMVDAGFLVHLLDGRFRLGE